MLNRLLSKMNGSSGDPAALEAMLAQLGSDRADARKAVEELQVRRHQALLDDAADGELDKIERQIERARVKLEKFDLADPALRERLGSAIAQRRRGRLEELRKELLPAARALIETGREAVDAFVAYVEIATRMRREGFETEALAYAPAPPALNGYNLVLSDELLDLFEREIQRTSSAPLPPPAAARRPAQTGAPSRPASARAASPGRFEVAQVGGTVAPAAKDAGGNIMAPGPVQPDARPPMPQRRVRALRADPLPADDSKVQVMIVRAGVTLDDGFQCMAGDRLTLDAPIGEKLLQRGAADLVPDTRTRAGAS